ncbi:MAG: hypothetical protein ACK4SY_06085 [Pyrobaculum sp.]
MYVVKCDSCDYVLYKKEVPKTVEAVWKMWGGICPKCMSPLEKKPIKIAVGARR